MPRCLRSRTPRVTMTGRGSPDGRRGDVCPGAPIQPVIAGATVHISRLRRGNAPKRSPMGTWKAYGNRAEDRLYSIAVVHSGRGEWSGADEISYRRKLGRMLATTNWAISPAYRDSVRSELYPRKKIPKTTCKIQTLGGWEK